MNNTSSFADKSFEVLFSKGISLHAGIRYMYTATSKMTTREYSNEYCYYRTDGRAHVLENLPPKGNLVLHGAGLGAK